MNEKGFTLIELLLVLSILTVLISLVVPLQFSSLTQQKEKQFIEQFHSDVLLIQNQASIRSKETMFIRFFDDHYKILRSNLQSPFAKRYYPDGWSFTSGNRDLRYHRSGTVLQPRTIVMYTKIGKVSFVFPLGKGRFYIDESERFHTN